MRKQQVFGIVLLIYSVVAIFGEFRYLVALGAFTHSMYISLALDAVMLILSVMMIGKGSLRLMMNTMALSFLILTGYYIYEAMYCFNVAPQISSTPDSQLPGLNALAGIGARFSGYNYIANSTIVFIMAVLGFLLDAGKKCGIACIVSGGFMLILNLVNYTGLTQIVFAAIYMTVAILLRMRNKKTAGICEAESKAE